MAPLFQIASGKPGEHCDVFPHGSLHLDRSKIHYFCKVKEIDPTTPMKMCLGGCQNWFPVTWPFISDRCVRCQGKRGVNFENRESYYVAVREEVLIELKGE